MGTSDNKHAAAYRSIKLYIVVLTDWPVNRSERSVAKEAKEKTPWTKPQQFEEANGWLKS